MAGWQIAEVKAEFSKGNQILEKPSIKERHRIFAGKVFCPLERPTMQGLRMKAH
jgi:hypothetical protein